MKEVNVFKLSKEVISRPCKEIVIDGCKIRLNFSNDPNENVIKNTRSILFYSFTSNVKRG